MKRLFLIPALIALAGPAWSQAVTAPPPAAAPAPILGYGPPVGLASAQALIDRAVEAAAARGFRLAIAVVEPSGALVAFGRMDDVQYGSIAVSQRKAETAARFRTATAGLEERVAGGRTVILALHEMLPVAGGVPIVVDGRVVGAIGVSGASSAQDDEIARAALASFTGG